MARLRVDDHPPDQTPSKKAKSTTACVRPLRTENRRARADATLHDPVSSKTTSPSDAITRPSRSRNRKRRADNLPHDQVAVKKPKWSSTVHGPSNFPPEFYDKLKKVWLTPRALRELDRQNEKPPSLKSIARPRLPRDSKVIALARCLCQNLTSVAAAGGLDLSDLRGCPGPTSIAHAMASSTVSSSSSRRTKSTKATTVSSKSRQSSAYDANFEQSLIDYNIFPPFYKFSNSRLAPKPTNLNEIHQALRVPRASLSPSIIPEAAFEDFQVKNMTKSKGTVMCSIIPGLAGNLDIPNEGHLPFLNLDLITGNMTVNPVLDFFDGALPGAVDKQVRDDLNKIIIPTTEHATAPVAPNLFLEAKGPGGTGNVVLRQMILNGGHGITIMHALDNYLKDQPVYNGNAYAFGATFIDGTLKLYAHHLAAPASPEQRPAIFTTQLKAYALTGDYDIWLEGTGAFRNLRMLAKRYRGQFIEAANTRARNANAEAAATEENLASPIKDQQGGDSSPADFYDCLEQIFAEPEDNEGAVSLDTNAGLAILDHGYFEHNTQDQDTEVPSDFTTSFASSFTSSFSGRPTTPTRPKHSQLHYKKRAPE